MHIDNKKCRVVQDPMTFSVQLKCSITNDHTYTERTRKILFFGLDAVGRSVFRSRDENLFTYFLSRSFSYCKLCTWSVLCLSIHPLWGAPSTVLSNQYHKRIDANVWNALSVNPPPISFLFFSFFPTVFSSRVLCPETCNGFFSLDSIRVLLFWHFCLIFSSFFSFSSLYYYNNENGKTKYKNFFVFFYRRFEFYLFVFFSFYFAHFSIDTKRMRAIRE